MRFKVKTREEELAKSTTIIADLIGSMVETNLRKIGREMIRDFNQSLQNRIIPGASPPQSERKGRPIWIHTPIEDAWDYETKRHGMIINLSIYNSSEHFEAVEFGVPHIITPKEAPYLVFDSSVLGTVIRKEAVRGQAAKGFAQAVIDEWEPKIPDKLVE